MRMYFCSDIHGSERCWKKFLATPKHYEADTIVIGGDITGKFIVPVIEYKRGKYKARFAGIERKVSAGAQLEHLLGMIADAGEYAFLTTPDEYAVYAADQDKTDALFHSLILKRVERWIDMAEDRLAGTGVRILISGGNDDYFEVDDMLARSSLIEDPNGTVVDLGGGYQIMGMGYGNVTPWACPRDVSEEELGKRIDEVMAEVADPGRTIMNLHVPPHDSGLDYAPQLSDDLRAVVTSGGPHMVPVGSTATRDAIATYTPMLGLHGHIHESRGVRELNGVPIGNPGSEYGEGILGGLLIDVDERHGLLNTHLVRG
ncbi:metallophosphoesterase [Mycolicibacterium madagascariense]|uniref:Metallophosphoesterase n=1 Tax=Mycolicibacterium madagascariense TaxID=212765 RepID=A0A7I7XHX2_9MYCO|nr:metallophosphoesterase [Mycolicibacterium madagascariense]MCV7015793.1 metallophosphoesterase [Mycolicibacterium madagascariense]BBZ28842.1 metallophosphoesterase [Mycolicibacterium madagascariense]